ncbi:MAG TPA: DUF6580 family putative transport protein [Chthoniobacterales bacterium]
MHNAADGYKFSTMIPAFLLIFSAMAWRILTGLFLHSNSIGLLNFAPLAAIALCSAAYFPAKFKFTVPLLALLVSDVVLNMHYGYSLVSPFVISHYIGFALVGCLGLLVSGRASLKTLLPGSIVASLIFYVVTNSVSWIYDPGYAKTAGGWLQCLTTGLPAYSATPTWMFFRNSLVGDLFFTALFVLCMQLGRSSVPSRSSVALPRPA